MENLLFLGVPILKHIRVEIILTYFINVCYLMIDAAPVLFDASITFFINLGGKGHVL